MNEFGRTLRQLRERRGVTQTELAAKADVTQAYIAKMESGDKRTPPLDTLGRLAKALRVPIADLIEPLPPRRWMSERHRWVIGVSPREAGGRWTAAIELWPPGYHPRTHGGMALSFDKRFRTAGAAVEAGREWARLWIDRQAAEEKP